MKRTLLLALMGAVMFGAGCAKTQPETNGYSGLPPEQRIAPSAATMPTASPEIPEAAKNVPRP